MVQAVPLPPGLSGITLTSFHQILTRRELSRRPFGLRGRFRQCSAAASVYSGAGGGGGAVANKELYVDLGVDPRASKADIKRAYRQKALQYHPDVNPSEDAEEMFIKLSRAYEVLVDDQRRAAYDRLGLASLGTDFEVAGAGRAAWDAFDTWDEFKPHKRKTRRGDAREAAAMRRSRSMSADESSSDTSDGEGEASRREAQMGDVVEYPLWRAVQERLQDGREKGVGFVVGRNKDRGDWQKLPPENVSLVEVEPLCYEAELGCWRADPLESSAFAHLETLRVLRTEFDRRHDTWQVLDALSEGCGSPIYEEEVIL